MTTANWLTLILSVAGVAVTWGSFQVRVRILEARVAQLEKELGKSREAQGARVGEAEQRLSALEGAAGIVAPRPRRTRGVPVPDPVDPDEST